MPNPSLRTAVTVPRWDNVLRRYSNFERGITLNISQLYSFIVVAQNENLSKAAGMLYVSQSALSKSIAKLEEELGVELFDRRGKKIVLNARGKRFLESSIGILHEIETATQDLRSMASGEGYKLRIGCPGAGAKLCDCMTAFSMAHPGVSFEIDSTIEQLDYVEMENFDMLVYPHGRQFEKLVGYPLAMERFCLAVPADHPFAKRNEVSADDLADASFVFIRQGSAGTEYCYRVCGAQAVRVKRQFFVTSHEMHRRLIHNGLGFGFVSESNRPFYEDDPGIALVPLADAAFQRPLMVCFRHSDAPLAVEQAFREFAISFFEIDTSKVVGGRKHAR